MRQFWGVVGVLGLLGCAPLEGPDVDLRALARPEAEAVAAPAPAGPALTTEAGWRTWVPRQTAPDGSISEGYWMETPRHGAAPHLVEPRLTIPRPPTGPAVARKSKTQGPQVMQAAPQLTTPSGPGTDMQQLQHLQQLMAPPMGGGGRP